MKYPEFPDEEVARYWDENADMWTEQVRKGWDAYREYFNNPAFFAFIGDIKGKKLLDAGCGEGYNTRLLAKKGSRVVGIDISKKMIEYAREREQKEPLGIRYEVASFSNLSLLDDEYLDVIVSFMALMDGPDYERALKELFRVLRKKGELIISITHPCFLTKGLEWIGDVDTNNVKLVVSNYFDDKPWVEHWRFSQAPILEDVRLFAVPSFPRTLTLYINTLIKTGFVLKEIEEPRPTEEACKTYPWLKRWREHAAMFLYVRAIKPS